MSRIRIYDTTLRDGSQGEGVNFSLQDKLLITRRLDELGVDFIEGGYPLSNPKDFEYFQEVRELPLRHARVAAFGMTRRKNARAEDDTCLRALRVELGIHCHNDCDVAVANTLAAVAKGATQVQGTVNGIGERCGNADLVSVIANLGLKLGYDLLVPGSLARLTEVSRYIYEI